MWWALAVLAQGAQLSDTCAKALEGVVLDANLTFWSQRATKHCTLKFQNELQNCCSSGVIPLLEKQRLVNNSRYGGWATLFRVPFEYADRWTPSPTPVPTAPPTRARMAAPTPSPTQALMGAAAVGDGVIGEVITAPPSPVPTAFDNIKPPPLQDQIMILAAPAAPLLFALQAEGGVDLSGGGTPPPVAGLKSCRSGCGVDCTMRPRIEVCNQYLGQSCVLTHRPLPNHEVMNSLWQLPDKEDGRTAVMLHALEGLTVTEDFCVPEECQNEGDLLAITYAYFSKNRAFSHEYITIACDDGSMQNIMYALSVVAAFLFLAAIFYVLIIPPKMPREYIVRRAADGGMMAS